MPHTSSHGCHCEGILADMRTFFFLWRANCWRNSESTCRKATLLSARTSNVRLSMPVSIYKLQLQRFVYRELDSENCDSRQELSIDYLLKSSAPKAGEEMEKCSMTDRRNIHFVREIQAYNIPSQHVSRLRRWSNEDEE